MRWDGFEVPMPIYEYQCRNGHVKDVFIGGNPFSEGFRRPNHVPCDRCSLKSRRVLEPVRVNVSGGFVPYLSEHIDPKGKPVWIKSKRHKLELLRKHGLVEKLDYFR